MVKTYLKYQLKDVVGLINGKQCKPITSGDGKYLYTASNEYILVIELKTGEITTKILDKDTTKKEVTCLQITNTYIAAGYSNGSVTLYELENNYTAVKRFSLHKSAVTSIHFNKSLNLM